MSINSQINLKSFFFDINITKKRKLQDQATRKKKKKNHSN